jgi:hypothetical protein
VERLLAAGAFAQMVAHGRDVYVTSRPRPNARHGADRSVISVISADGAVRGLTTRADPWLHDLFVTDASLLWTEQNHRMQAAWRRAICAMDVRELRGLSGGGAAEPTVRVLVEEESMRNGVHGDGHGGALVSTGGFLGRVRGEPGAALTPIVEAELDAPRDAASQVTFANALGAVGEHVVWSSRSDDDWRPFVPTRLCRAPLEGGGTIEVLRASATGNLRLLGPLGGALLFEDEGQICLREEDGRVHGLDRAPRTLARDHEHLRWRVHDDALWLHTCYPSGTQPDAAVHVYRRGATKLEALPYEATQFDVTPYGLFRLTDAGVHVMPWE